MSKLKLPITEKTVVENLIPQKKPFVMVDKLIDFSENYISAGLKIQKENIFVNKDIFQESGIIEHMAQTVALYTGYQYFLKKMPAPTGYIGSIKSVEISHLPKTGDEIETKVKVLQEFAGVTLVDISTFLNGNLLAVSQMKTIIAS